MPKSRSLILAGLLVPTLLAASGCATVERERAQRRQEMMARAGFEKKPIETEAQRSQVEALPARKLVRVPHAGEVRYVYGDLDDCQCLLAGSEDAYQRYLDAVTREFVQKQTTDVAIGAAVSEANLKLYQDAARESILDPRSDASLDWEAWGSWE